jgi:hypothetical protein
VRVSWLSLKTKVDGLSVVCPKKQLGRFSLVLASKLVATVFSNFASKPVAMVFPDLASKLVATISGLSLKTKVVMGFPFWTSTPAATVW